MSNDIIVGLVADLEAEALSLQEILAGANESDWDIDTPATGWTVRDQVAHLGHFDDVTRQAIAEPEHFIAFRDRLQDLQGYVDAVGSWHSARSGADMLRWWSTENDQLRSAALTVDPKARVPWFGPSMSLASKVTARIMETWAHGQDIVDALGVDRAPTDRLKHVARIGVLAFPNSYRVRGLDVPEASVRVELESPSGQTWEWGDESTEQYVRGPALDFCLVVTQRRHHADTNLEINGPVATEWMQVAQAFAGPPGTGRVAGQFADSGRPA